MEAAIFPPKPLEQKSTRFYFNADRAHRGCCDYMSIPAYSDKVSLTLDYKKTMSQVDFVPLQKSVQSISSEYDSYREEIYVYSFSDEAVREILDSAKAQNQVRHVFLAIFHQLSKVFNGYFYMYNSFNVHLQVEAANFDSRKTFSLFQGNYFECTLCAIADRLSIGLIKQACLEGDYEGKNSVHMKLIITAKIGLFKFPANQQIVFYSHLAEPLSITPLSLYTPELTFLLRQKWRNYYSTIDWHLAFFIATTYELYTDVQELLKRAVFIAPPFVTPFRHPDVQYRTLTETLLQCFSTEPLFTNIVEGSSTHTGTYCFKLMSLISQKRICLQRLLCCSKEAVASVFSIEKSFCLYMKPLEDGTVPPINVNLRLRYGDRHYFAFSHQNPSEIIPKYILLSMKHTLQEGLSEVAFAT